MQGVRLLFASAALLLAAAAAASEDSIDHLLDMSLEDLMAFEVVTPTRTKIELGNVPGSVTVITRDHIRKSAAQTIPELLRRVPGLNIRWNTMVQTIDVRAFGSNPFTSRVLLLIDGVPYNSWNKGGFPQHPGFDFFNLEYVSHIEILRGPGSALYGENAFNGVINIVTLSGSDDGVDRLRAFGGEGSVRMASITKGVEIGDSASLFLGARRFEGVMPTELWRENSDGQTSGYDLFGKFKWRGLELTYYRVDDSVDGFTEPFGGGFLAGRSFTSAEKIEQTIDIVSAKYSYQSDDGRWGANIHGSYATRNGSHCGSCHAREQSSEYERPADHGDQNYVEAHFNFALNEKHQLLAGVEHRALDSGRHTSYLPDTTTERVQDYDKSALFIQDHIQVTDRLQLIAGVRYDGKTNPDLFDAEFFPRLDAVYSINDKVTVRAQWGEAARYPSFSELYQSNWFISAAGPTGPPIALSSFVPNPTLGPEYIKTLTLGGEAMLSESSHLRVDLYRNVIEDYITIAYPQIRFENHPQDAVVSGFEIEHTWEVSEQLTLSSNYSFQHNKTKGNGTDSAGSEIAFTYAPKHKVNLGIDFSPIEDLNLRLDVHWKSKYRAPDFWYGFALQSAPKDLDAYTLANLRLDYRLPFLISAKKPLRLSLIGRNLGNERPHETLTGSSARIVGREVFVELEYSFAQ